MRHLDTLRAIDVIARHGSIRRAAETLAITSTALNRRILALEAELGAPIFERLPRGVRLSSAGEILVHHARNQISDMERVRSRIADLSGARRGHVSVAGSQAVLPFFLPSEIARYRDAHPAVTFDVRRRDRDAAEAALADYTSDLAIVFEPVRMTEFQTLVTVPQPICAVMAPSHPLADCGGDVPLRLHECLAYPLALPSRSYGVRYLIDAALGANGARYRSGSRIRQLRIPAQLRRRRPDDLVPDPCWPSCSRRVAQRRSRHRHARSRSARRAGRCSLRRSVARPHAPRRRSQVRGAGLSDAPDIVLSGPMTLATRLTRPRERSSRPVHRRRDPDAPRRRRRKAP